MTATARAADFQLHRTPFGKLVLTDATGTEHTPVLPVRAFPIQAPEDGVSLLSSDGHELGTAGACPAGSCTGSGSAGSYIPT